MERPREPPLAPDGTGFTRPSSPGGGGGGSSSSSPAPEMPAAPPCAVRPPLQPPVPCTACTVLEAEPEREEEEEEDEEEEEEEGLNELQGMMKTEHRQALRSTHRGCVILERHRRKRITQSCSRLRQLLPTIPGGRIDMVTVLEMTVAYLETIKQVSAQRPDIQLCPPAEVHSNWLLQSHMARDQGHKLATELESKLRNQGTPTERRWVLRSQRGETREDTE